MGRSRAPLTTKIHSLVDADGRQVNLAIVRGQVAHSPMVKMLLDELTLLWRAGARTTQGLEGVAYVGDDLLLLVIRKDRRLTFLIDTSLCSADSTARMTQAA